MGKACRCARPHRGAARGSLVWIFALVFFVHARTGWAAEASPEICPAGNLVHGATQTGRPLPVERFALLSDGVIAREGSPWPGADVVAVIRGGLALTLSRTVVLRQLYLQSDADQAIHLEVSPDGATWVRLVVPPHDTASGMLSRAIALPELEVRFVRLSAPDAAAPITLSELGLYCKPEERVRRTFRVAGPPREEPGRWSRWKMAHPVSPAADDVVKLVLVLCTALCLVVKRRKPGRALDLALAALGFTAALAYANFGSYRYPDFLHEHDVFHYFVGAKYFPELGYDGLYECATVAEADAGFERRVALRSQRDLRTNRLVSGTDALTHAGACRERFTPPRWAAFASDVRYFVDSRTVEDWHRILKDHGFNASPTWIAFGAAIARPLPAAAWSIGRGDSLFAGVIGPLDPLLLLAAFAAVVWAFGFRAAAVVTVVFGCNPLAEYSWVGGGFLRELWLSTLVVGICLLKKERPVLGGVLLALSALLQLFPGAALVAVALAVAVERVAGRPVHRAGARVLAGAVVATALLATLSTALVGRSDAWSAFAANTEKHAATPSGNLVGLPSALSFRMSTRASLLFDENATDPFARVRRARTDNALRPLQLLGAALGLLGLYRCIRERRELWFAAAMGLALVPLLVETSCYYTAWLSPFALVGATRWSRTLPVLGTLAVSLLLLLFLTEIDVSSAFASWALVAGVFAVLFFPRTTPESRGDP
jgi:hypothetical protein